MLESALGGEREEGRGESGERRGQRGESGSPLLNFGDYELLEEIARGGMGVVYKARQISLNRLVAVKMILAGKLANSAELQRFQAEAETAARLQHPNIVAMHEIGEREGQPFFSMDYVEGRSLAELAANLPMPARRAARYVQTIAEAVQYAHSQGVLHRDLKPSNILIDHNDQPRITDFGLAKRLREPLGTPATASHSAAEKVGDGAERVPTDQLTLTGQVLGSPNFMPPEQASGARQTVGPASDVYSLGAILYQLLTGRPPFMAETLTETLRLVAETDPVSPRLLVPAVPRDLQTICLKSLQKESQRRYPTAQELADDLGRYLRHEPIIARPVGKAERVLRWCRRNPVVATSVGVAVGLLLLVAVGSPVAAYRINRARQQALENEKKTRTEATKSAQVARFLKEMLRGVGPSVSKGRNTVMLREILDQTADRISKDLKDQPAVEAELCLILGKTYRELGEYEKAEAMAREALKLCRLVFGQEHLAVAEALDTLGEVLYYKSDLPGAEAVAREALAMKRKLLAPDHKDLAPALNTLANVLQTRNKLPEAEALHREALAIRRKSLGNENMDVAGSLNNLANVLLPRGDLAGAEACYREALTILKKLLGDESLAVATVAGNLGILLSAGGDLDGAEAIHREVLKIKRKQEGNEHPDLVGPLNELAMVLAERGRLVEAEALVKEALEKKLLGSQHWRFSTTLNTLAIVLSKKGDLDAAEAKYREALALRKKLLGTNDLTAETLTGLGVLLAARGHLDGAESCLRESLLMLKGVHGEQQPELIATLRPLSWVLQQRGNAASAEALRDEAVALSLQRGKYSAWALIDSIYEMADLLQIQGKFAEAEPLLMEAFDYLQNGPKTTPPFQRGVLEHLTRFYEAWDKAAPATGKSAQAIEWQKKLEGFDKAGAESKSREK